MKPAEHAQQLFTDGFSCSQSVFAAYAEKYGLPPVTALKVSAAFGGGMGRKGEVCGAATGALMVIGMEVGQITVDDRAAKEHTYALTHRFLDEFAQRTGALRCADLLGCHLDTPEGMKLAQEKGLTKTICPKLVAEASQILSEILDEK